MDDPMGIDRGLRGGEETAPAAAPQPAEQCGNSGIDLVLVPSALAEAIPIVGDRVVDGAGGGLGQQLCEGVGQGRSDVALETIIRRRLHAHRHQSVSYASHDSFARIGECAIEIEEGGEQALLPSAGRQDSVVPCADWREGGDG